ncbi:TetR/AcrR family transcriptional regulator [Leptospira sarikeiensis]|uniref:TetR/AcrR family transcriptional regulator n=1 Tax=Leptospira sarikeiensis TaxID=2484943 RepID=A0A4R9KCH8_9LEPT|nr:TetR/AcrR family transcriptional regulator [Leptospira sarikeiensis]TGL64629.1 TetR/AcrR family transcriptional regulator [Leptospira sarikeiensis]
MKREQQSAAVRKKILETARKLFVSQGYEKTTTRAIISRAKITTGTLYHFYKSKDEILLAISEDVFEEAVTLAESWAKSNSPALIFALEIGLQLQLCYQEKMIAETYTIAYRTEGISHMIDVKGAIRNSILFKTYNPGFTNEEFLIRTRSFRGMLQANIEEISVTESQTYQNVISTVLEIGLSIFGVPSKERTETIKKALSILKERRSEIDELINNIRHSG